MTCTCQNWVVKLLKWWLAFTSWKCLS